MNRVGELIAPKDVIPERSLISKEIDELLDSVYGAVKARIQLGLDHVA